MGSSNNIKSKVVLIIVAHPDDAEIGCGGLIARLVDTGWSVHVVILTDGSGTQEITPAIREREQLQGLDRLGLSEHYTHFLRRRDGSLNLDKETVGEVRALALKYAPEFVVTHSEHDSHQDHVCAHRIVSAAVRDVPILSCYIPTSTRVAEFAPILFVSYEEYVSKKALGLSAHESQIARGTFTVDQILQSNRIMSAFAGVSIAEPFEVQLPPGGIMWPSILTDLNDAVLPKFWNAVTKNKPIAVILPEAPAKRAAIDISTSKNDFISGSALALRLQSLPGYRERITLSHCQDQMLPALVTTHCCIYVAGVIPNTEAARLQSHFGSKLPYTIGYKSVATGAWIQAGDKEYRVKSRKGDVEIDYGFIAASWANKKGFQPQVFVWAAGITGYGTYAAVQGLMTEGILGAILTHLDSRETGFQVLLQIKPETQNIELLPDSFRSIDL